MATPSPIWGASIHGGTLTLDRSWEELKAWIRTRRNGRYDLTIKAHRDKRSSHANGYYWGVVIPMFADHLGYDRDDLHYELRRKFLTDPEAGELSPPRSSASLDSAEFARFVDDVRRLAAQYGCSIPDPNEVAL